MSLSGFLTPNSKVVNKNKDLISIEITGKPSRILSKITYFSRLSLTPIHDDFLVIPTKSPKVLPNFGFA